MRQVWTRRDFIHSVGLATASLASAGVGAKAQGVLKGNKREVMLDFLDTSKKQSYVPAAFFLHFDPAHHQGEAAVEKHLEYFRYTGMDFLKIQFEKTFPHLPEIRTPADWAKMPLYREDFYEPQLKVIEGLVKRAKNEALVIVTLYSPFMFAAQTTSDELIVEHIIASPGKVKKGMEVITESVLILVKSCIRAGVDGFYHSTQGGESYRFRDSAPFRECIKPYDLAVMKEIDRSCIFNILHICDYTGGYDDLSPFLDYPGHVVNCSLKVGSRVMTPKEASQLFGRPYMGGMERKGALASGSSEDIRKAAEEVLGEAPEKFILGADCTVPSETPWDNLRIAVDTAHSYRHPAVGASGS